MLPRFSHGRGEYIYYGFCWLDYNFFWSTFDFLSFFRGAFGRMVMILRSLSGPCYDGKYLREVVRKTLGIIRLHQTLTNVVIPTFDIKCLQPIIFASYEVWFFPTVLSSPYPLHHWKVVFQTCKICQYTFVVDTHTLKVSPCLWQLVRTE
jgi:hypothetical protein